MNGLSGERLRRAECSDWSLVLKRRRTRYAFTNQKDLNFCHYEIVKENRRQMLVASFEGFLLPPFSPPSLDSHPSFVRLRRPIMKWHYKSLSARGPLNHRAGVSISKNLDEASVCTCFSLVVASMLIAKLYKSTNITSHEQLFPLLIAAWKL